MDTTSRRPHTGLLDPQKQQPPLGLFDFFLQRPPIARSPPRRPIHFLCFFPALDRRLERDLACIERRHPTRIRVACKYHHRGACWKGRVERHEVGVQCRLRSGECFWRGLCRRGHDGRIRRRFWRHPWKRSTHVHQHDTVLTTQGIREARKPPKQELVRGDGLH